MNRYQHIIMLGALALALTNIVSSAQEVIPGDLPLGKYESKYYSVYVPADWIVTPALEGLGREKFTPQPESDSLEDVRFEVVVMRFPATLEEYITAITNQDPETMRKASLVRDKIAGVPAFRLTYAKIKDGEMLQANRTITIQDGIVYDMTLSFLQANSTQYHKLMTAIFSSFEMITRVAP